MSDSFFIYIDEFGSTVSHFFGFLFAGIDGVFDFIDESLDGEFVFELSGGEVAIYFFADEGHVEGALSAELDPGLFGGEELDFVLGVEVADF